MVVMNLLKERNYKVLKQRIISAVILALCFMFLATQSSVIIFTHTMSVVILVVSWEWAALVGLIKTKQKLGFVASVAAALVFLYFFLDISHGSKEINTDRAIIILCLGIFFWIVSTYLLRGYPDNSKIWNHPSKIAVMGLMALVPAWCGMIQLKYIVAGGELILVVVIMVAVADIAGYFFGKAFGVVKFAPKISPNKTWAGVWGAATSGVLVCFPIIWVFNNFILELSYFWRAVVLLLGLMVVFFSIVGDLLESMLKRNQNMKDSGSLLPGHGGILDRVDGLISALPIFTLVMLTLY
jgi:phosphatidate cytidylyltransferase